MIVHRVRQPQQDAEVLAAHRAGVPGPVIRWQYSAGVSRISPADLVHVNGLGSLFHSLIRLRMPVPSWATLRWAERRSLLLVTSANQRSARFSQELLAGVKCRPNRGCLTSHSLTAEVGWHPDRRDQPGLADVDAAHPVPVQRLVGHLLHPSLT